MKNWFLLILLLILHETSKAQLQIGDLAPEIKLPDTAGKWKPLSEVKSKLILLDFWAVWCYPCVKSMPDVKRLYDTYHDKGLEVYAVSLDKGYYNWVDYLRREKLPFIHVNDAYSMNGKACKDYFVESIPCKMLLKDGKIIAKEMSLYDLEKVIKKELNGE